MRKLLLAAFVSALSIASSAQAYEDKIEYNKVKQACLVMDYKFSPLAVENAIISKMNNLGYKGREERGVFNKDKGFRVYKGALITDISTSRYDYIINIDKKSRKEPDVALLYLLIMTDDGNALPRLNTEELGKAKSFLYNLIPDIEEASLELDIIAQEDVVSKAEKKLKTLQSDKDDMEKRIKKLQDDIKSNEKDQERQTSEIENQRKALEALKGKRKKSV